MKAKGLRMPLMRTAVLQMRAATCAVFLYGSNFIVIETENKIIMILPFGNAGQMCRNSMLEIFLRSTPCEKLS